MKLTHKSGDGTIVLRTKFYRHNSGQQLKEINLNMYGMCFFPKYCRVTGPKQFSKWHDGSHYYTVPGTSPMVLSEHSLSSLHLTITLRKKHEPDSIHQKICKILNCNCY